MLYGITESYATFIIILIGATPPPNITKNRKPDRKIYKQDKLNEYFFFFLTNFLPQDLKKKSLRLAATAHVCSEMAIHFSRDI